MIDPAGMRALFQQQFGPSPLRFFWAPGRVNLIGEHTDYNKGYVLPMALNRGTLVAASARADKTIRAHSVNLKRTAEFDLVHPEPTRKGSWTDYVNGVASILERNVGGLTGADLVIQSDIPIGAGLSSSAALELSTGLALASLAGLEITPLALARAAQQAEHEYAGIQCGIMDQYVAAFGRRGAALLIDCRSLQSEVIPLALDAYQIIVCDSHVMHALAASEYNHRRSECEQGLSLLQSALPDIDSLRDVSVDQLNAQMGLLPEPLNRRCRHVCTENERTVAAAEALKNSDVAEMGRLMTESHISLRDDYQVSCAELDLLVDAALKVEGVLGARMTGGGFGGCTVNLVHRDSVEMFESIVERDYKAATGKAPSIFHFEAEDGARELDGPIL